MKNLYSLLLLLALLLPTRLLAQGLVDDMGSQIQYLFAPVDKSQVPTGFLMDYGLPLLPLDVFNGTLTDSSRTNPAGFRFLYGTVYSSRVYGANPLPTLPALNARINAASIAAGAAIPLMVQRIDYARVRPDAFSLNLLSYQNGQVYDVAGRSQSPYEKKTLFAAAPDRGESATGDISFIFTPDLHLQSGGGALQTLTIDFGDGRGYVPANWNQPVGTSFTTAGSKRIKIRATYAGEQTGMPSMSYDSHFDVRILQASPTASRYSDVGADIPMNPVPGVHSGATVTIRYGGNHTQLIKPFIVVEGYDKHYIAPHVSPADYDIRLFLTEIETKGSFRFRNALDSIGEYDLVFINFNNGTDDLLRNAVIFEQVLNEVEQRKVINPQTGRREDNVVMGMSMGGLISRYKLAEMTKAGRPTHTRLLVLQDSPQRGANVPLGIQAAIRQANISFGFFTAADLIPTLSEAILLLDEPATRQLLVHRATNASGGFEANTFINGAYRNMIDFGTSGPQPTYSVVAASQGSQCARSLFAPYSELVGCC